ncbi:hypothetical protein DFH06DRAFT_1371570 [Mycena polygramma]|nr:hypothetical protein DFH06DRAFT_1371570 [Mycena polygramma]
MSVVAKISDCFLSLCDNCDTTFIQSPLLPSATRCAQVLHMLRTNQAVDDDATDIQAVVSDAPAEIVRYEAVLQRVDAVRKKLLSDREVLKRFYGHCVGIVDAPVRRLPKEILSNIFSLCGEPSEDDITHAMSDIPVSSWNEAARHELWRIGGGALAACSQVSAHWRDVVRGTPTLWSAVEVDLRCWTAPEQATTYQRCLPAMLGCTLRDALKYGQQTSLSIRVHGIGELEYDPTALDILAEHCERWSVATFVLHPELLRHLSPVEGRLPRLEMLSVNGPGVEEGHPSLSGTMSYFSKAPCLHSVQFHGPMPLLAALPLEQLIYLALLRVDGQNIDTVLPHMTRLPSAALETRMELGSITDALPRTLPSMVWNIEALDIHFPQNETETETESDDSREALGAVFGAITVPYMGHLGIFCWEDLGNPLFWPQSAARALFRRSFSHRTLQSLCLRDVVITASELLECLAELPSLDYLFISDHPTAVGGTRPRHLITTDLLRKLSPSEICPDPDDCLVPNLRIIELRTLGWFTDDAFLDFVGPRSLRDGFEGPFDCTLLWLPGYVRALKPGTLACLQDLLIQPGKTVFECREYDPDLE